MRSAESKLRQALSFQAALLAEGWSPHMHAPSYLWNCPVWGRTGSTWLAALMQHFNLLVGPTQGIWSTTFRTWRPPKFLEVSICLTCLPILGYSHIFYNIPLLKTQNFCVVLHCLIFKHICKKLVPSVTSSSSWVEIWRDTWWKGGKRSFCFSFLHVSPTLTQLR